MVIGGAGHIGTYLTPRLVGSGHETISVSRGQREPYQPNRPWEAVRRVVLDRAAEEGAHTFGGRIRDLRPDAVIDLTRYLPDSARHLVDALRGSVGQFLHCATIWVHGPAVEVPITEEQPRKPFGDYGCRKAQIERYLLEEAREGFAAGSCVPAT